MDKELLELLNKAKTAGASKEQLIQIRDNYLSKKKGVTEENTPSPSENSDLDSSEPKQIGISESQKVQNSGIPTVENLESLTKKTELEKNLQRRNDVTNVSDLETRFKTPPVLDKDINSDKNEFDISIFSEVEDNANKEITDRDNRISSNLQSFRDETKLTKEDEITLKERFDSEKTISKTENIIDNTLTFFKKAINPFSTPVITIPFEDEINEIKSIALEKEEKLTNEQVLKRAEELFIEKEKDNIFNDKANTFLSEIDSKSKGEVNNLLNTTAKGLSDENKKLTISNIALKEDLTSGLEEIKNKAEFFKNNPQLVTKEDVLAFNSFKEDLIQKAEIRKRNDEKIISNTKDLQSVEKEHDFFKRTYDGVFRENLAISASDLIIGGIDFVNFISKVETFGGIPIGFDKDKDPLFNTSQIREEQKSSRESIRKPVESVESVDGFLNYSSDLIANQLPITLATATGYGGLAAIGASSTGQKHAEMTDDIKSGKQDYNAWQMMLVPVAHGSAEAVFELPTLSILKKGKRVLGAALKESPTLFRKTASDMVKDFGGDFLKEHSSEQATNLVQNGLNIYALGKEGNITDNALDVFKDTSVMTLIMQGAPHIMAKALKPFQSKDNLRILEENAFKMKELYKDINNTNITDIEKALINKEIEKLTKNSSDIMRGVITDVSEMDEKTRLEILDINEKAGKLRIQANEIKNNGKSKNKEYLLEIISNEHQLLQEKRENILLNYANKNEISFNKLSQEEKLSYIDKAGEILSNEQINKGNENFTITEEQTQKKAEELFKEDSVKNKDTDKEKSVSESTTKFAEEISENKDNVEDISDISAGTLKVTVGDTSINLKNGEGDNIKIESVSTKEGKRGQGSAKNALAKVSEVADNQGKTLELNVVPLDNSTKTQGLIKLYESEGFVKEEGFDNKDGGKMIRLPETTQTFEDIVAKEKENIKKTESKPNQEVKKVIEKTAKTPKESNETITIESLREKNKSTLPKILSNTVFSKDKKNIPYNELVGKDNELENPENLPTEEVSISDLIPTQRHIKEANINDVKDYDDAPVVIRRKGELYISDGHHRVASSILKGDSKIEVKILDLNKETKSESKTKEKQVVPKVKEQKTIIKKKPTVKEVKRKTVFKSGKKSFTVKLADGKLVISPLYGKKKPYNSQIRDITKQYVEATDFDKGEKANFEGTGNLNKSQQHEFIADNSKNAQEVATALNEAKNDIKDTVEAQELTLEDAISQALNGKFIDKNNHNHFTDLSKFWKGGKNKTLITLDDARRVAQEILGTEVDINDVIEFAQKYNSVKDYNTITKEIDTDNLDNLKQKFQELTGLRPTDQNIKDVTGKSKTKQEQKTETKEDSVKDDEVPFQTESEQTGIKGNILQKLIDTLKKTGLAKTVKVLSDNAIAENLKRLGIEFKETPLGFVDGNTIYINSDKVKADTPIHEFSHLWMNYAKENHAETFSVGLNLIEGTNYHKAVQNNPAYKDLTKQQQLEEALAQAIGESGVELQKESAKKYDQFKAWFKKLFTEIAKGLGIRNMTGLQLANLSLKDFTRRAAADLLAGKKIGEFDTKQPKNKIDVGENSGIEFLMEQQTTINDIKIKLKETISNKKAEEKDVKKAFLDYLKETIKRKGLNEIQSGQLTSLLNLYDKTVTEAKLNIAIKKIDTISNKLDQKEYKNHIGKLKSRAIAVEVARNKKKRIAEKRTAVKDYLKQSIKDKTFFSTATFNDIVAINNAINNNNIDQAIEMIDKVAVRLEKRYNLVVARNETKKRTAEEKLEKLKQKIQDEKNKYKDLKENFASKKKEVAEVKKAVLDYINDSLDNNLLGKIKKSDLKGITKQTKVSKLEDLQNSLDEIDNIVLKLQNLKLNDKITSLLDKGKAGKQANKDVAKSIVQERATVLNDIKKLIKTAKSNKKIETEQILNKKLDEIRDEITELTTTPSQVDGESGVLIPLETIPDKNTERVNTLLIAENIILSKLASDPAIENQFLEGVRTNLEFIVKKGKHELIAEKEVQTSKLEAEQAEIIPEIDGNNSRNTNAFNDTMDNIKRKFNKRSILKGGLVSKKLSQYFLNPLYSNLTTLRKKLSKNPSNGSAIKGFQRLIVDIDFAEINMNQINENWGNEINDIKDKIFKGFIPSRKARLKNGKVKFIKSNIGSRTKADWALSESIEVTIKTPDGDVKESFSASVLLDVLLKSKNPNNLEGLDKSGFTKETIDEIESKLSDNVKQYGQEVMDFYKKKYKEINDVYRKMYFRNLPFDEFYSGKLNISGVEDATDQNLFESVHSFGTTAGGSLKTKTQHKKAITPSNVDSNLGNYITQMSKFIAYAEVHRRLNKTLNNQDFQKAVYMNNKGVGGDLLDQLKKFKERHIEKTKVHESSRVINLLNRNYIAFILGGKLKQIPIQMVSAINGQFSLPKGLTPKEWAIAHANIPKDALYLFENSKLIKQRLNTKQAIKAFSSIDDSYSYTNNMTQNDRVNLMFRLLGTAGDKARAIGMTPIKVGDMLGVSGQIPVFGAAKIKIKQQNPTWSDSKVAKEAMLVFEDSVNRTQQGQTKGVKSYVQNQPLLKLLINFKTTPILNINESWIALNDMKKGKNASKSKAQNIATIINFGILQNSIYTLVNTASVASKAAILAGTWNLLKALFDDEDDDEQLKGYSNEEKDLLYSLLGGQFIDGMYIGSLKTWIDLQLLKKDFSFGTSIPIVLKEEMDKFDKNQRTYLTTENPTTKRKAGIKMISSLSAILAGMPPKAVLEYLQYHTIVSGENIFNEEEKAKLREGHSFSAVNFAREERTGIKLTDLLEIDANGESLDFTDKEIKEAEKSQELIKLKNEAKEKIKSGDKLYQKEELDALGITEKWQFNNANFNNIKFDRESAIRKIKRGTKLYNDKELKRLKITPKWQNDNKPK
ncbi:MAG: hypothetical protein QM499_00935 [Flavobacteriaceae bacterium]